MKSYCKFTPGRFVYEPPYGTVLISLYELTRSVPRGATYMYDPVEILPSPPPPFRVEYCPRSYIKCCGSCTYRCTSRCLQDIATRLHYLEHAAEAPELVREMAATLRYSELTPEIHHQMISLIDEVFCSPKGRRLNRQYGKLDYASQVQYFQDEEGRQRVKVDPVSGALLIHEWPKTGLCPYCIPAANRRGYIRDKG